MGLLALRWVHDSLSAGLFQGREKQMGVEAGVGEGYHTRWALGQVPEGSSHPEKGVAAVEAGVPEGLSGPSDVADLADRIVVEAAPDPVLPDHPVS